MSATYENETVHTLNVRKVTTIAAPIEVSFEALLEEMGPYSEMPGGVPFPMVLEPWPGGRWYRGLDNNAGHLWGHVQVIKPPMLLEICGPLFMSYPAVSHLQYRLTADGQNTTLELTHRAIGLISAEHMEGVNEGWEWKLKRVQELAQKRAS